MDTFTKPLIKQFGHPRFKWLIPKHIKCLNIFFELHSFLTHSVIWYSSEAQAKTSLLNEKAPKTRFTQMVVSFSFIQALPELLTTQRDLNSSSSDLDSILVAGKTTNGFNLFQSVLVAKHKLSIHFS